MRLLFFFFVLLRQINVFADYGPGYIFQVEVTYSKGIVNGYIDVVSWHSLTPDSPSVYINNDKKFTQIFKDKFHEQDTLHLYKQIYRIDSLSAVIHFSDKEVKIPKNNIVAIKLKSYFNFSIGTGFLDSYLKSSDLSWIKKKPLFSETYQNFHCGYTLFFFEKKIPSPEFEKESKKYIEMNYYDLELYDNEEKWDKILDKYFKWLQNQKVLIVYECSC